MEPNREVQSYYNNNVVSIGEWIVTFILLAIPVVNLILLLVWGFSNSTPLSKKNYAIAMLIMMVVGTVLGFLFWASIFSALSNISRVYNMACYLKLNILCLHFCAYLQYALSTDC